MPKEVHGSYDHKQGKSFMPPPYVTYETLIFDPDIVPTQSSKSHMLMDVELQDVNENYIGQTHFRMRVYIM